MPTYMMREIVNGKMIGHPVEADDEEEARSKFKEALPFLLQQASDIELRSAQSEPDGKELLRKSFVEQQYPPAKNDALNGRKFLSIEFQCMACGSSLEATFLDGYLQVSPCPTCLGELENMVSASKRFLDRKK
jgi:hypothetical protein